MLYGFKSLFWEPFCKQQFYFCNISLFFDGQNFHFKKELDIYLYDCLDDLNPQNANSINSCTRMLKLSYDVIA